MVVRVVFLVVGLLEVGCVGCRGNVVVGGDRRRYVVVVECGGCGDRHVNLVVGGAR